MGFWKRIFLKQEQAQTTVTSAVTDSRGIQDLLPWIRGEVLLTPGAFPETATAAIKAEGAAGSAALVELTRELLDSRNSGIVWPLLVAERLQSSPELVQVIQLVIDAPGLRSGVRGKFPAEIEGTGKIGWTDGTEARIKRIAARILDTLAGKSTPTEAEMPPSQEPACVHCGKSAGKHNDIYDYVSRIQYARCDECARRESGVDTVKKLELIRAYPEEQRKKALRKQ